MTARTLSDVKLHVRFKLSALWVAKVRSGR